MCMYMYIHYIYICIQLDIDTFKHTKKCDPKKETSKEEPFVCPVSCLFGKV